MYLYIYVHVHTCIYTNMYMYMYKCTCTYTGIHCTYMYLHHVRTYMYMYMYMIHSTTCTFLIHCTLCDYIICVYCISGVARNCLTVGHVRSDSMQSAPARGVWGHAPPEFFLNFRPSELLSGVFNECCGSLQ